MATQPNPVVPPELNPHINDAISMMKSARRQGFLHGRQEWRLDELTYCVMVNHLIEAGYLTLLKTSDLPIDDALIMNMKRAPMFATIRAMILAGVE